MTRRPVEFPREPLEVWRDPFGYVVVQFPVLDVQETPGPTWWGPPDVALEVADILLDFLGIASNGGRILERRDFIFTVSCASSLKDRRLEIHVPRMEKMIASLTRAEVGTLERRLRAAVTGPHVETEEEAREGVGQGGVARAGG